MKMNRPILYVFLAAVFGCCTKKYDCENAQIPVAFINYPAADMDSFVLRKFKANENYRSLLDTLLVVSGQNTYNSSANDTTYLMVTDGKNGIKAGFDWQIFIPATNKTVLISNIISENKTGKRGYGIFSMDPAPGCINNIYSVVIDNNPVNFTTEKKAIYINH